MKKTTSKHSPIHRDPPPQVKGARRAMIFLGTTERRALHALAETWSCTRGEAARRAMNAAAAAIPHKA